MEKSVSVLNREKYPRPDFIREDWQSLDGIWEFSFEKPVFDRKIVVPFCYQSQRSGIYDTTDYDTVWYRRSFTADGEKLKSRRLLLHFGAVDEEAQVWVNGKKAGTHQGGYIPFTLDVTDLVHDGENTLMVQATDRKNADKPRGKQTWTGSPFACWYTPVTGIWQSVWTEYAGTNPVCRVKITPNVQGRTARCECFLDFPKETRVTVRMEQKKDEIFLGQQEILCRDGYGRADFSFPCLGTMGQKLLWSPEFPNLIDVTVEAEGGDRVFCYFGMREIRAERGRFLLNGADLFQRLVLDQGYWPDTLLTPPDGEALKRDIELTKAMGFNGVRKHQKIEDPRYYYWADKLGLLVWGELPSAYEFRDTAMKNSACELAGFVERDYNHPCIITWVPINESWGVENIVVGEQEQAYCRALLWMLKALDETRLVSANDGWEQISETDICAVHDYALFESTQDKYDDMEKAMAGAVQGRMLFAKGNRWTGQPVMMTEYGGIAFVDDKEENWGYFDKVKGQKEFLNRLEPINRFLIRSGKFAGFCYTQLTDVMQETNGLLTPERKPKVPLEKLKNTFGLPMYGE